MTLTEIFAKTNNIVLPENITEKTKELFIMYKIQSKSKKELAILRKQMYMIEIPRIQAELPNFVEFKQYLKQTKDTRIIMESIKTLETPYNLSEFEKKLSDDSSYHKLINFKLKFMYKILAHKKIHSSLIDYVFLNKVRPIDILYLESICKVKLDLFTLLQK